MAQQAAAVKPQQAAEVVEEHAAQPEVRPAGGDGAEGAEKVVALHGGEVQRPDPAGPDIDLFDNVPV